MELSHQKKRKLIIIVLSLFFLLYFLYIVSAVTLPTTASAFSCAFVEGSQLANCSLGGDGNLNTSTNTSITSGQPSDYQYNYTFAQGLGGGVNVTVYFGVNLTANCVADGDAPSLYCRNSSNSAILMIQNITTVSDKFNSTLTTNITSQCLVGTKVTLDFAPSSCAVSSFVTDFTFVENISASTSTVSQGNGGEPGIYEIKYLPPMVNITNTTHLKSMLTIIDISSSQPQQNIFKRFLNKTMERYPWICNPWFWIILVILLILIYLLKKK